MKDDIIWKIIIGILIAGFCLFALRAMSWADEGVRGPTRPVTSWPFSQNQK